MMVSTKFVETIILSFNYVHLMYVIIPIVPIVKIVVSSANMDGMA